MSKSIHSLVPDPDALLALEPEELAGVVLEHLNSIPNLDLNRTNYFYNGVTGYPQERHDELRRALMEAWNWLEREGLIAPYPSFEAESWYSITRRGKQIVEASDLEAYRRADILPKRLLHPVIAQKVWAAFLRGDYDIAVFQAFKEVEVGVRTAGGFDEQDLGTGLMRKAFHVDNGPLTDQSLLPAEKQALSDLFAGAIGSYKNPHSHRNLTLDATEAVEMIMLASHLLKIVDTRSPTS